MKFIPSLCALASLCMLAVPAQAQAFTSPLSVSLNGVFKVTQDTVGVNFAPITPDGTDMTDVALTWVGAAPSFTVHMNNGGGWNALLSAPGGTLKSGLNTIPIDYNFGGTITGNGGSDPLGPNDSSISGSLGAGTLKTVSCIATKSGKWTYKLGNFKIPSLLANKPAGTYTGTLTTTIANSP